MKEQIVSSIEFLTLVGSVLVVLLFAALILKNTKYSKSVSKILNKNYLVFGFVVSLIATLGSLFYSEIMGYNPCVLCWYQRIFMYPQTILFLIAMKTKNKAITVNSIVFSMIGGLIAVYHYLTQIGAVSSTCDAVGYSAACSEFFSLSYGFITIPMMAIVAFFLLVLFGIFKLKD